jgi:hypothetical protein
MQILAGIVSLIALVLAGGWLGLQIKAERLPTPPAGSPPKRLPMPDHLPAPALRFARAVYGDDLPDIQSAIVQGRGRLAPFKLPLPARFRFYYDAVGSSHYHDIQVTWFNRPFIRIHARNLEGHATLDLGMMGRVDNQPHTNRAAVQGYWGEVLAWLPAIALTDPRVRWEAIDDHSARLHLPGLEVEEAFTITFDPETGLLDTLTARRYQSETNPQRWLWRNHARAWGMVDGQRVPVVSQTQWNEDKPWATWEIEHIALNVDVSARFSQFGGDVS